MKRFSGLLGLVLISSLFVIQPVHTADLQKITQKISEKIPDRSQQGALAGALLLGIAAYNWRTSQDSSTRHTLQALKEYTLGAPELKWKKGVTAASLALAYATRHYCKSKPVSAIAGLASLIPLYTAYKDISLLREVQSAKEGQAVKDEHIKEYIDFLCFNRDFFAMVHDQVELVRSNGSVSHSDGNMERSLQAKFFNYYKKRMYTKSNCKIVLKNC